jgi:hypothetical protein
MHRKLGLHGRIRLDELMGWVVVVVAGGEQEEAWTEACTP